jgi:hypothetical protein
MIAGSHGARKEMRGAISRGDVVSEHELLAAGAPRAVGGSKYRWGRERKLTQSLMKCERAQLDWPRAPLHMKQVHEIVERIERPQRVQP